MPIRTTGTREEILGAAQRIVARKGYAAVGISEVLADAGVPKGSFYHWFSSKDDFGRSLVEHYFEGYLANIDRIVERPVDAEHRLLEYWQSFYDMQVADECRGRCLVVKLGAEVSDLSDPMRLALITGIEAVIDRIERMVQEGLADGTVVIDGNARDVAKELYDGWIGASVIAKVNRRPEPLDRALQMTRVRLRRPGG